MRLMAECVACKHRCEVTGAKDIPMCPRCFSPMVITRASWEADARSPSLPDVGGYELGDPKGIALREEGL